MRRHAGRVLWIMIMVMALSVTYTAGSMIMAGKASPVNRQNARVQVEIPRVKTLENSETQPDKAQNAMDSSGKIDAERISYVYVYYYRTFNGWLERRLWNRTKGEWAWSTWHRVKKVK